MSSESLSTGLNSASPRSGPSSNPPFLSRLSDFSSFFSSPGEPALKTASMAAMAATLDHLMGTSCRCGATREESGVGPPAGHLPRPAGRVQARRSAPTLRRNPCHPREPAMSIRVVAPTLLWAAIAPAAEPALPEVGRDDWPWWRGPTLDNKSRDTHAPMKWSRTENIVWKTPVPGRGHSSPVLWGDRVFLTTADEAAQTQRALAFDRKTGKPLWNVAVHTGGFEKKHEKNSHASATPACDGQRVYSAFV